MNYAAKIGGILPGPATLRCLILLWTGDYPAQSEIAKTISHGIRPCWRCELEGKVLIMHCKSVYYNFINYIVCILLKHIGERYQLTSQYYYAGL